MPVLSIYAAWGLSGNIDAAESDMQRGHASSRHGIKVSNSMLADKNGLGFIEFTIGYVRNFCMLSMSWFNFTLGKIWYFDSKASFSQEGAR